MGLFGMEQAESLFNGITALLIQKHITAATMESCTAGLIASLLTDGEGSSAVSPGGFVTYCNAAKIKQGVPAQIIETYGVYSPQTAIAMATACREAYGTDVGIGVTGSFGNPDPRNADSICGQVHFALVTSAGEKAFFLNIPPQENRLAYKLQTACAVGNALLQWVQNGAL